VIAIDASSGMVEALAATQSDLDVRVMEAGALAFDDATFDVVTAGFVMHLPDDPPWCAARSGGP
jgi:ubiquinone/menaquinone biosynthesis C-methylase UbiE